MYFPVLWSNLKGYPNITSLLIETTTQNWFLMILNRHFVFILDLIYQGRLLIDNQLRLVFSEVGV